MLLPTPIRPPHLVLLHTLLALLAAWGISLGRDLLLGSLALFLALGARVGEWGLALSAFLAFTLVQA